MKTAERMDSIYDKVLLMIDDLHELYEIALDELKDEPDVGKRLAELTRGAEDALWDIAFEVSEEG